MNTLIFLALVVFSTANASVIGLGPLGLIGPLAPGVVIQGPSAQTALAGADGSALATAVQGGTVATGGILGAAPGFLTASGIGARAVIAGPSGTIIANNGLGAAHILGVPRLIFG